MKDKNMINNIMNDAKKSYKAEQ